MPFSSVGTGHDEDGDRPAFAPDRFRPPDDRDWPGHWASPPSPWQEQPVERLEAAETLAQVRAAIDALPATQRTVITLRDLRGFTSGEVSELLSVSPGNQRVLLHRARATVRRHLRAVLRTGGRPMTDETPSMPDLQCIDFVELVTDYLEGALASSHRALVESHLEVCPGCRTVLAQWREIIVINGRLGQEEVDDVDPAVRQELIAAFCRAYPPVP